MADRISKEKRSWNMSRIHNKDTSIEKKVRSWLFSKGYRFRKNDKRYPGKPDVVLPKYKAIIFINGCYWHHHKGCKYATIPQTRTEFWIEKFEKNMANDQLHTEQLKDMGWNVITIWECQLKKDFESVMNDLENAIREEKTTC